jgi:hypothetical protein
MTGLSYTPQSRQGGVENDLVRLPARMPGIYRVLTTRSAAASGKDRVCILFFIALVWTFSLLCLLLK